MARAKLPTLVSLLVVFVILLTAVPPVPSHASTRTLQQHWELLADTGTYSTSKTLPLRRGILPGGTSGFDPSPVVSLEVVAAHAGGVGASWWNVALLSTATEVLASLNFTAIEAGGNILLKSEAFSWPASDKPIHALRLTKNSSGLAQAGSLLLRKAYLRIQQDGVIRKTIARVPLATLQTDIAHTEWQDVSDLAFYEHIAWDFDPAPTLRLRTTGVEITSNPIIMSLHTRLVDSAGEFVPGSESLHTSLASRDSSELDLSDRKAYHLQVRVTNALQRGELHSADLVLQQASTDPQGIRRTVGWFPGVTAATNVSPTGGTLGFRSRAPAVLATEGDSTWLQSAKVGSTGTIVQPDLVSVDSSGTPQSTLSFGLVENLTTYSLRKQSAVTPPPPNAPIATQTSVSGDGTGRVAQTVLRLAVALWEEDVSPLLETFEASATSFSPNDDGTLDSLVLTALVGDVSGAAWEIRIDNAEGETVISWSGSSEDSTQSIEIEWNGHYSSGDLANDGAYEAVITATDPHGYAATSSLPVVVDTLAPSLKQLMPAAGGTTWFRSAGQIAAALVDDSGSGIDVTTSRFLLERTDIEASQSLAAALSEHWMIAPFDAVPGGTYRLSATVGDAAGNVTEVNQDVGFLVVEATPGSGTAFIPRTSCEFTGLVESGAKEVLCDDVPLAFDAQPIQLSASQSAGRGHLPYTASLAGVEAVTSGPDGEISLPVFDAADSQWGPRTALLPFFVSESHSVPLSVLPVEQTIELAELRFMVPDSWTSAAIEMGHAEATAGELGCVDPSLHDFYCSADLAWSDPGPWAFPSGGPHIGSCDSIMTTQNSMQLAPGTNASLSVKIETARLDVSSVSLVYSVNRGSFTTISVPGTGQSEYAFTIPGEGLPADTHLSWGFLAEGTFAEARCSEIGRIAYPRNYGLDAIVLAPGQSNPDLARVASIALTSASRQPWNEGLTYEAICALSFQSPTPCEVLQQPEPEPSDGATHNLLELVYSEATGGGATCPKSKALTGISTENFAGHDYGNDDPDDKRTWDRHVRSDERQETYFTASEWDAQNSVLINGGARTDGRTLNPFNLTSAEVMSGAKVGMEFRFSCSPACTEAIPLNVTLDWTVRGMSDGNLDAPFDPIPQCFPSPQGTICFPGGNPFIYARVNVSYPELWKVSRHTATVIEGEGPGDRDPIWLGGGCLMHHWGYAGNGCGIQRSEQGTVAWNGYEVLQGHDYAFFMQLNLKINADSNGEYKAEGWSDFWRTSPTPYWRLQTPRLVLTIPPGVPGCIS